MALTAVDYEVFMALREAGAFPPRPSVLELGESEWYGDVTDEVLAETIDRLVAEPERRRALKERLAAIAAGNSPQQSWDFAKLFYAIFLDYRKIASIDFHGTPEALKLDLNQPLALGEQFDLLINGGTGEHVFDVRQFFSSCHQVTRPGGLMLHLLPFLGWLEHGFYNFNPTFFWDLAQANGYAVVLFAYTEITPLRVVPLRSREALLEMARAGELGQTAMLYAVLRKPAVEAAFRIPMQGVYAGGVSSEVAEAWHTLR
jgi:SAM-dependent methyltransferase